VTFFSDNFDSYT